MGNQIVIFVGTFILLLTGLLLGYVLSQLVLGFLGFNLLTFFGTLSLILIFGTLYYVLFNASWEIPTTSDCGSTSFSSCVPAFSLRSDSGFPCSTSSLFLGGMSL